MADPLPLRVEGADDRQVRLQRISVRDIRVAADIGVHAHEIGRRQPLIVTVNLTIQPVTEDRLATTFDYNQAVAIALALAEERIALIETFAFRLASACLDDPAVREADVLVEKPGALVNGCAAARIVLRREG